MNEPKPGRYETSRGVPFTLVQVDGGYRREFDASRWTWDEARVWTSEEVATKVRLGVWKQVKERR